MRNPIRYRDGYNYVLAQQYVIVVPVFPLVDVATEFVKLSKAGVLTIEEGFAWDGASGMQDHPQNMRGACIHDALYGLMRLGLIDHDLWRDAADRFLRACCIEDGMPEPLAELMYHAVRLLGAPFADPAAKRPLLEAPPAEEPVTVFREQEASA